MIIIVPNGKEKKIIDTSIEPAVIFLSKDEMQTIKNIPESHDIITATPPSLQGNHDLQNWIVESKSIINDISSRNKDNKVIDFEENAFKMNAIKNQKNEKSITDEVRMNDEELLELLKPIKNKQIKTTINATVNGVVDNG